MNFFGKKKIDSDGRKVGHKKEDVFWLKKIFSKKHYFQCAKCNKLNYGYKKCSSCQ